MSQLKMTVLAFDFVTITEIYFTYRNQKLLYAVFNLPSSTVFWIVLERLGGDGRLAFAFDSCRVSPNFSPSKSEAPS
jgi:hypothetical protein